MFCHSLCKVQSSIFEHLASPVHFLVLKVRTCSARDLGPPEDAGRVSCADAGAMPEPADADTRWAGGTSAVAGRAACMITAAAAEGKAHGDIMLDQLMGMATRLSLFPGLWR